MVRTVPAMVASRKTASEPRFISATAQATVGAKHDLAPRLAVAMILIGAGCLMLATSPVDGDFWWSDAPRHALNGAFVKDFAQALPLDDPRGWAVNYYLQYPALTILFYPPLFYVFEAIVFAIFGVSHLAAQATVILFLVLLAWGAYALARPVFPRWSALGFSLLTIGAPETAFWARQVMLDIPAYAGLVVGVFFFVRYLREERPRDLYCSMLATLAAVYIKINAIFIAPVLVVVFLLARPPRAWRDRHVITAVILALVGLIPIVTLTLRFGMINVVSLTGRPTDLPLTSLDAWLFYAKLMPQYLGWATLPLAVAGLVLFALRRPLPFERWFAWLLIGWLVFGYVFFSAIALREQRHAVVATLPLVFFAVAALHWMLPKMAAQLATLGLGAATLVYGALFHPVPSIAGYDAVADYVAKHAKSGAIVVFSGYRDGNFIFNMRTHEERRDLAIVRSDKLLLKVAVERVRGVEEMDYDERQIAAMLRDLGATLIVYQPGFWEDLRQMARFAAVLKTPDFEKVAEFPITGTVNHADRLIEIYRPTYAVKAKYRALQLDMPIIGDRFDGFIGHR